MNILYPQCKFNIAINRKLAVTCTTMRKISLGGVLALKRASVILTFQTVYSALLQEKIIYLIFLSGPTLLHLKVKMSLLPLSKGLTPARGFSGIFLLVPRMPNRVMYTLESLPAPLTSPVIVTTSYTEKETSMCM